MTVRREMAEWRATSAIRRLKECRLKAESRKPEVGDPNTSAFSLLHQSRFSRQSRPSRLSQASAIAAEALMNHAG
jgi:hypothetical protein